MVNYGNGKIYKVQPIGGGDDGDIYIGSTTKQHLSQRMVKHRCDYHRWVDGVGGNITVFAIFDKYGVENCEIVLLEKVNASIKDELIAREKHYITTETCVNKKVEGKTVDEFRDERKRYNLQYYINNKDKVHQHYEDNKDAMLISNRTKYDRNKDKISEKGKVKFQCECGSICRRREQWRHNKSARHIKYLEEHNENLCII